MYVFIIQLTLLHFFSLTSLLPYYNRHYLIISLFFSLLFNCICCLYLFLLMFVCVCLSLSHPLRLSLFLFLQKNWSKKSSRIEIERKTIPLVASDTKIINFPFPLYFLLPTVKPMVKCVFVSLCQFSLLQKFIILSVVAKVCYCWESLKDKLAIKLFFKGVEILFPHLGPPRQEKKMIFVWKMEPGSAFES